ncbi:MAG: hypothetical protein LBR97_02975 [Dysgonamonadaceae bacterium]|jgi:hypothetical protein|nr:hypothetical protein [Dysgonamonadaceae bacterium]
MKNLPAFLGIFLFTFLILTMSACTHPPKETNISSQAIDKTIVALVEKDSANRTMIEKGVKQVAKLWLETDGNEEIFIRFCIENYFSDPEEKQQIFLKISNYLEAIWGNFNEMTLQLQRNIHEATGSLLPVDELFAAYNPGAHFSDDFYTNKMAFIVMLNFPELSLEEKEQLGNDRLAWAYARLGDTFTTRIPAGLQQAYSNALNDADVYISSYNIYAGHLLDKKENRNFPEDMILLSHWNLRDEIKANYNQGEDGLNKQQTIYEVMKRIISQEIPKQVINSGDYEWNPFTNTVYQSGKPVAATAENTTRYEKFLNNFKASQAIDECTGNTYIDRNFSEDMEIAVDDAEALFKAYLSSPILKTIGKKITARLGRNLEAFDIWYDGFKQRSNLNEDQLSEQTRKLYPDAESMQKQLPDILLRLGFTKERANYIAGKVAVDAARGSGHAWGAAMKGQKSHLRTRIPDSGMDYKGYNIAIHEFGHNVEQTLSLYDVDYYLLNGVPNTAFTEALAFVFQKRDLELLGIKNDDPEKEAMDILDKAWHLYEIGGVSMLDIAIWKWLYAHPQATSGELKEAVIRLSKEVWNTYFAPVFGIKDETVLAVYSHTISYPLYLSAYAFGQIIEFQLEQHLNGKDFATEVDRIYRLGCLTPNQWMLQATGKPLSCEALLNAVSE